VKVFVTGGTGFVGSHLVNALLARGDEVVSLVRDPQKAARVFSGPRKPTLVRGTVESGEALRQGARGVDVVYHVAGLIAARSRAEFFRINAEGTRLVAAAAREAAPKLGRFVYVSSLSAGGPSSRGEALTESAPPRPLTAYGESKLAGEEALAELDLPWTVVRPPVVYGPGDTEMLRVFRLARLGVTPVFGDGSQQLCFIFVADLVQALLKAALAPAAHATYYAAHREVVTSRTLVASVYHAVKSLDATVAPGTVQPLIIPIPGVIARSVLWLSGTVAGLAGRATLLTADKAKEFLAAAWVCSPAALERDTGWRAEFDLEKGLALTAAWYREAGWL